MSLDENTYNSLQELSNSDFKIVEGEPNIIGWEVRTGNDLDLGEVEELLFDPESKSVRYLVVALSEHAAGLEYKKVLIPIGIAQLHESDDEVILPEVTMAQLIALPAYEKGALSPESEVFIRNVLANPTPDIPAVYVRDQFYIHPHFNDENFYRLDKISTIEPRLRSSKIEPRPGNSETDESKSDLI